MKHIQYLLTLILLFMIIMTVAIDWSATQTRVIHVNGHTCIETKGVARSISCDWSK